MRKKKCFLHYVFQNVSRIISSKSEMCEKPYVKHAIEILDTGESPSTIFKNK